MMNDHKRLLLINMEYTQDEINEPINMDILLQCIPYDLFPESSIKTIYRDLQDTAEDLLCYSDVILISSKISSFERLKGLLSRCTSQIVFVGGVLAIGEYTELANLFHNVIFNTGEAETNMEALLRIAYYSSSVEDAKQSIISQRISNVCFVNNQKLYVSERDVCDLSLVQSPIHHKLQDVIRKNGLVRMETSRGCPWNKCSFCIMPWRFCGSKWRAFSNEKIENEINEIIEGGANQVYFTDEDFIGNYQHIVDLCDIITRCKQKYHRNVSFGGSTSVMTLLNLGNNLEPCLLMMQNAGVNRFFIGIESGSESQLTRYKKGVTVDMNERIIRILRQYKFEIDYGFIMFDAETNLEELEENLEFLDRTGLRSSFSRFSKRLRLTPHTEFCRNYHERRLVDSKINLDEMMYEYKFCDPIIQLINDCVDQLDEHVLSEMYRLQAFVRSGADSKEREIAEKKLLFLRNCTYSFLKQCVKYIRESDSDNVEEKIISLMMNHIKISEDFV